MNHELGVENWMSRAGPDLNDSKEPTRHEECMEAEIAELREKLAEAQKQIASFADIASAVQMAASGVWEGHDFTVQITAEQYATFNS
jgi:phytoene/squalene synthetase